jgi:hypothetical protein
MAIHLPLTGIFCPAGEWTTVDAWANVPWPVPVKYRVGPLVQVRWRMFSAGIPPYLEGSFSNAAVLLIPVAAYVSIDFNPETDTDVIVE